MDGRRLTAPRALLAALVVTLLVATAVGAATTSADFGVYNARWDGATGLQSVAADAGVPSRVVLDVADYPTDDAAGTLAVVLTPDEAYDASERDRLRRFVRAGGTLLVAEDYGTNANPLLAATGAGLRVDGAPVRDERRLAETPAFPRATVVADHPYTRGVDELTLNHGTVLADGAGAGPATVLVATSAFAYVDANGNEELDADERLASRPVAAVEPVGEGRVVAVADPSLFVNAMLDRAGNRAFARALFAAHDRVLLDYSHAGAQPPLAVALLVVRGSPLAQAAVGALALGAVLAVRRRSVGVGDGDAAADRPDAGDVDGGTATGVYPPAEKPGR
jgi:hypothetical protein